MKTYGLRAVGLALAAAFLVSCGQSGGPTHLSFKDISAESTGQNQASLKAGIYGNAAPESPRGPSLPSASASEAAEKTRLVITTGSVLVEVKSFSEAADKVKKKAAEEGGFVGSSNESKDEAGHRYGALTIRIPAAKYEAFVSFAATLGELQSQSSNAQDITEEFYDLEARLKSKRRLEEELLKLLSTANRGKVADLLEVERELERVRSEVESMEGRRRFLADQSVLSTLTVELREPSAFVSVEPRPWEPLTRALGESLRVFAESIGGMIIFVAGAGPWIVVVGGAIVWLRRRWKARKEKVS